MRSFVICPSLESVWGGGRGGGERGELSGEGERGERGGREGLRGGWNDARGSEEGGVKCSDGGSRGGSMCVNFQRLNLCCTAPVMRRST